MKTYLYSTLLIISFILISCGTDDFPKKNTEGILLTEVVAGNEVFYKYTYTNSSLISEEKSKFHFTKHTYNSKNQLIQSDYYWDERIVSSSSRVLEETMKRTEWVSPENTERDTYTTFEYGKNGMLQKSIAHRFEDDFATFKYNNGRIVQRTSFHENKASVFDNYFYDDSGNLIKTERYYILSNGEYELATTTEYELDNKHNPYYLFRKLMIPGRNTNPNNITKEIYKIHFEADDFIEPVQVTAYQYEYNSEGFPVKRSDGVEYIYF